MLVSQVSFLRHACPSVANVPLQQGLLCGTRELGGGVCWYNRHGGSLLFAAPCQNIDVSHVGCCAAAAAGYLEAAA